MSKQTSPVNEFVFVNASAGTGKTSYLVIMHLKSLAMVTQPEQVCSVTFTRKASRELSDRIMGALIKANELHIPINDYEVELLGFAKKVLANSKKYGWNILQNPNRLNVQTIDGLCAQIVKGSPALSGLGVGAKVCENVKDFYRKASTSLLEDFSSTSPWADSVKKLLLHFNNDFEDCVNLLSDMLSRREQWLPFLSGKKDKGVRAAMNLNNQKFIEYVFSPFLKELSFFENDIVELLNYSSSNLGIPTTKSLPGSLSEEGALSTLMHFSKVFLTTSGKISFRKSVTKNQGFPGLSEFKNKEERELARLKKEKFGELTTALAGNQVLMPKVKLLTTLNDIDYSDDEWQLLSVILELLPILVAKLKVLFQQNKVVDFIEIAQGAIAALGDESQPSQSLLRVDNKIHHLLIDEFQDTSYLQLYLATLITSGWSEGDGKSIYIVGDKKQSIYGFRAADVTLFDYVQKHGINGRKFKIQELKANYRSQSRIVDAVNEIFSETFINSQRINDFSQATPTLGASAEPIRVNLFTGDHDRFHVEEASYIIDSIRSLRHARPDCSIAILAKSRADVTEIIQQLKSNGVAHRAVDIHPLSKHPVIMDLLTITRATISDQDRIAWLALLRSPFVGLSLSQLENISYTKGKETIFSKVCDEVAQQSFTDEEIANVKKLQQIIQESRGHFGRKCLSNIVRGLFIALGGPVLFKSVTDRKNLETFLNLLVGQEPWSFDLSSFETRVNNLFSEDDKSGELPVSVMTIHKSKGLEFDYVFVPGAHKVSRADDKSLMVFDKINLGDMKAIPIMAGAPASLKRSTGLYKFIREYRREEGIDELRRLAYVVVTRAKEQVVITGFTQHQGDELSFPDSSLLGIMRGFEKCAQINYSNIGETQRLNCEPTKRLHFSRPVNQVFPEGKLLARYRGLENAVNHHVSKPNVNEYNKRVEHEVLHSLLSNAENQRCTSFESIRALSTKVAVMLRTKGMHSSNLVRAVSNIQKALYRILNGEFAQWLFFTGDLSAFGQKLQVKQNGEIKTITIDRTFVVDGCRWIIDFNSSEMKPGEKAQCFEKRLLEEYQGKMLRLKSIYRKMEGLPVKLAIFSTQINYLFIYNQQLTTEVA